MYKSVAFFDVDETIINIKSMFDFFSFWCIKTNKIEKLKKYISYLKSEVEKGGSREKINREYYMQFKCVKYNELLTAGEIWFKNIINSDLFISSTIEALRRHQLEGVPVVFLSGSMLPIASYLDVRYIICTQLLIDSAGNVTGEIGQSQTIGEGKKIALLNFCNKFNTNPKNYFSYGDDLSDIPMLESTGNPVCVGGGTDLAKYALLNGWLII
ncbi:HAD-IB family hydrolase [Rahnella sp. AA]|uniref:HAD-IB family phosphatase n=1 Tax=Rahnella sp. AA TaxID=2057180 RepID=UPI000C33348F|nr:HAD-IB family phosphatase [Rahnella sp. AA]PKE29913.1 HAD-IB family hydrolase [Rahnella sp. AA]